MGKIKPKECQNVEFKSIWKDEYLKWICGFANAQGAAMYFGVDDNHEVVGLNDSKKLLEDIPNKIVNYMGLVVDVNLYEKNGLDYIELIVNPSNVPISFKGKYYYRSGSTMQELNGAALQQFIMKKMGKSWDDVANENATFDDIDREAINYFLRKGIEANRILEDERNATTQDVLASLHLLDENGHLKNAALLLFGNDPLKFFTSVRFKIGRFGIDEADLLIQDVIEGNIIQMADRVVEVLKAKYLTSPVRFDGMQRKEELEVPVEALREILYNSIAHKDYTGPDIQMHVYNDHVEIWNEGELPEGYDETAEENETDAELYPDMPTILVLSEKGVGKRSTIGEYRITNRNGKGVKTINITEKTGKLVAIKKVMEDEDIMIINKSGVTIRLAVADIKKSSRNTQGVKLIDIQKRNDVISSVCVVEHSEDPEDQTEEGVETPETNNTQE